jgi:hypothetical protein
MPKKNTTDDAPKTIGVRNELCIVIKSICVVFSSNNHFSGSRALFSFDWVRISPFSLPVLTDSVMDLASPRLQMAQASNAQNRVVISRWQ